MLKCAHPLKKVVVIPNRPEWMRPSSGAHQRKFNGRAAELPDGLEVLIKLQSRQALAQQALEQNIIQTVVPPKPIRLHAGKLA